MARPRLIAVDVDGTLARSDGSITERTKRALRAAADSGIELAVATGRPWLVAQRTIVELDVECYAICSNGAMVLAPPDFQVMTNIFLPEDLAHMIITSVRKRLPGVGFALEFELGAKAEEGFARRLPEGVPMGPPVDDVLDVIAAKGPVRKVMMFHDDYDDDLEALELHLREIVGDQAQIMRSGLPFAEAGPNELNKAVALAGLGVPAEQVVAVGDEMNDIAMLTWAGTGLAMGNAPEPVKLAADGVLDSNDDDGLAAYLEEVVNNG